MAFQGNIPANTHETGQTHYPTATAGGRIAPPYSSRSVSAFTWNRLYIGAGIFIPSTRTFTGVGWDCTTTGVSGETARIGIWTPTSETDFTPGSLVAGTDTGQQSVAAIATGFTSYTWGVAVQLTRGWYFPGMVIQDAGSGTSTVAARNGFGGTNVWPTTGDPSGATINASSGCIYKSGVSGTLGSFTTISGFQTNAPIVWLIQQ